MDKAKSGFYPSITADAGGGFSQRNDAVTRACNEHDMMRVNVVFLR